MSATLSPSQGDKRTGTGKPMSFFFPTFDTSWSADKIANKEVIFESRRVL